MIPERFRTIWGTRTFSTPCATQRWRRTDLKTSGRIKCSAGYGVGSEILRKSKCKNHRNNACKVTDRHPALLHQLFDMPVTQGIGDIPAHAHEHDIWWKMGSLEADRHRRSSSLCLRSSQPESIPQMYPKRKLATE